VCVRVCVCYVQQKPQTDQLGIFFFI